MTLRARKRHKDAVLFRRYEKDRRSRFNALLDKLASLLPNFSESNSEDQKWTKAQVVDNAIKFIKVLQQRQQTDNIENAAPDTAVNDVLKQCKILKKQNKKFRDMFKNEFAPTGMTDKDFCQLDFGQLYELIKQKKVEQHKIIDAVNDAGDVFVVENNRTATALNSDDHTYSLIVQQEAEVEIGSDAEQEEVMIIEGQIVEPAMVQEQQVVTSVEENILQKNNCIFQSATAPTHYHPNGCHDTSITKCFITFIDTCFNFATTQ